MEYRKFEKLGVSPSLLGFGCMRFPLNPDGSICEEEAEKMVDTAIQAGVTYIDTAYPYHNGDSEPFLGRILKKYSRQDYFLATKLPIWNVKTQDDAKRLFDEQLKRLDTEYVDFYLLHCLDKEKWQAVLDLDLIPYFEELKRQGKIRFFGFPSMTIMKSSKKSPLTANGISARSSTIMWTQIFRRVIKAMR